MFLTAANKLLVGLRYVRNQSVISSLFSMPLIADRMALVSYGSSDEGSDLGSDREEEEEKSTPQQPASKKSLSPEQPPPQNSNNVSSPPKVPSYKLLQNCILQFLSGLHHVFCDSLIFHF